MPFSYTLSNETVFLDNIDNNGKQLLCTTYCVLLTVVGNFYIFVLLFIIAQVKCIY